MENQKETVKKEDVLETENHIIAERLAKLDKLRAEGVAYPNDFVQKDRIEEVRAANGSKTPSGRNIIHTGKRHYEHRLYWRYPLRDHEQRPVYWFLPLPERS